MAINQSSATSSIIGDSGDDILQGTDQPDIVLGAAGNDTISGLQGSDSLLEAKEMIP